MKFSIRSMACAIIVALSAAAHAEIYESKDAEGNPVFTDTPTAGAEAVKLQQENIADPVKAPPQSAPEQAAESPPAKSQEPHGNVIVIPNSRNEELSRELAADKPHEVLEAEKRYEVGDQPTPEEIERRKQAKEGEYIDKDGNTVRYIHRGKAH